MSRSTWHAPVRRLSRGARALGQGLLALALIALAASVFLPGSAAAPAGAPAADPPRLR